MNEMDRLEQLVSVQEKFVNAIISEKKERDRIKRLCIICASLCFVSTIVSICILGFIASGITIGTTA